MGGETTVGLSGGQRKLLLFELIFQRTRSQENLLICLDEPFAGVTDDFVPYITNRLMEMKEKHYILLVTNDHISTLTGMANNTITVSAIDRSTVSVNERKGVERDIVLAAMSIGKEYEFANNNEDLWFFIDVEIIKNSALMGVLAFTFFVYGLFLLAYWDSKPGNEAPILVAAGIMAFFALNPYLIALVDWRVFMAEEAEALVHSSKGMSKALKSVLCLFIIFIIALMEYGAVNIVIDTLSSWKFFMAIFFDSGSLTFPFVYLQLHTNLATQPAQVLASFPFLFMFLFSTTFSPGSGIEGLKGLRYLFSRFYFWCMVPGVQDEMEGCPEEDLNFLALILSSFIGFGLFCCHLIWAVIRKRTEKTNNNVLRQKTMKSIQFAELQGEFHGCTSTGSQSSDLDLDEISKTVDDTDKEVSFRDKDALWRDNSAV
eukprot:CAMPEP_0185737026 /NCGR_PEP_ID=MMETSP1171-20130828/29465_1 /TAXON_ID=374046 /ORGANISM="Helicotheca tamensis, Strain CCMP826" /LENGTH=429 /DNA_ID=CAMNT_0028407833 /DNA_START=265 /DNA_END=1554 /DNA_ORIENTATION=-